MVNRLNGRFYSVLVEPLRSSPAVERLNKGSRSASSPTVEKGSAGTISMSVSMSVSMSMSNSCLQCRRRWSGWTSSRSRRGGSTRGCGG
eukprot:585487-Prorocentrum_minimum.AAC.2